MLIAPRLSIRQNPEGSKTYIVVLNEFSPEYAGHPSQNFHEETVVANSPHEAALTAYAQVGDNDWGWANHVKVYERVPNKTAIYRGTYQASEIHAEANAR